MIMILIIIIIIPLLSLNPNMNCFGVNLFKHVHITVLGNTVWSVHWLRESKFTHALYLKLQCATCKKLYLHSIEEMKCNMHNHVSLVYKHLKIRTFFHVCNVEPISNTEQINYTGSR